MPIERTTAAAPVIRSEASSSASSAFLVSYISDEKNAESRVIPLGKNTDVTIGRQPGNTLPIDHEMVSRLHARISSRDGEITVEDLHSRNGTFVNGEPISGRRRVASGDEISVGPATLFVRVTTRLRDALPIASGAQLDDRLASEVDRAVRYRRPLGIVMLRLVGPAQQCHTLVEMVAKRLRRMDFLAEYLPQEYALVLPEADRAAASAAVRRLRDEVRSQGLVAAGVEFQAGVGTFPEDGATPGELISRARAALRVARDRGGLATPPPDELFGDSVVVDRAMKQVMSLATRVASTPITVLILGETGVGKEVVANAIHRSSQRSEKLFVALNCSALPEALLESELFGHERGAFTGADQRKIGYFEAAEGGTILLDEVGEMSLATQAKLLRVLEQREITRVGGTNALPVDVRIVCATNRDLEDEIRRGRFREDLYFRLSAFTLAVPPLRDRLDDIIPLAERFARQFALELGKPVPMFDEDAIVRLKSYAWPGNVRELRNAIERAAVLGRDDRICASLLPERILGYSHSAGGAPGADGSRVAAGSSVRLRVAEVEKSAVIEALDACGGNQTHAAGRLGISRFALIRLMKKYDLKKPRGRR